jgi:hypothetical protein
VACSGLAGRRTNSAVADLDAAALSCCMIYVPQSGFRPRLQSSAAAGSDAQLDKSVWLRFPVTSLPNDQDRGLHCRRDKVWFLGEAPSQVSQPEAPRPGPDRRRAVDPLSSPALRHVPRHVFRRFVHPTQIGCASLWVFLK